MHSDSILCRQYLDVDKLLIRPLCTHILYSTECYKATALNAARPRRDSHDYKVSFTIHETLEDTF
jgi:hypothetical protein